MERGRLLTLQHEEWAHEGSGRTRGVGEGGDRTRRKEENGKEASIWAGDKLLALGYFDKGAVTEAVWRCLFLYLFVPEGVAGAEKYHREVEEKEQGEPSTGRELSPLA